MDIGRFVQYMKRHGLYRTALSYSITFLQRLVDFQFMRVYMAEGPPREIPEIPDYITRCITETEYEAGIAAFRGDHQRKWAFERGDRCFANFHGDHMVGYTFYSTHSTLIRTGLELRFPDTFIYGYAGFTEPSHRGRRLALARSNMRRRVDWEMGIERRVIWYVAEDNYDAQVSLKLAYGVLIGYLGYFKFGHRFLYFASPRCKRVGISLIQTSSPR